MGNQVERESHKMGNQVDNKFSWVIQNFKSLSSTKVYSDQFSIGGCKWQLFVNRKRYCRVGYFSLYLKVYEHRSLPRGWTKQANICFTIVNQISEQLSRLIKKEMWFDEKTYSSGFSYMLPNEDNSGFLLNGELKILVEIIDIVHVIGESVDAFQPLKKEDEEIVGVLSSDLLNKTQHLQQGLDVYGCLLLPSQVESVKRIFENHPDIASEVLTKSQHLRKIYINVLLGLIETLCQPLEELKDEDLNEASSALSYVVNAGFKVDWLEKKLNQVLEKKKIVKSGEACLLKLNKMLEKERADVAAAKIPLSFDDFL